MGHANSPAEGVVMKVLVTGAEGYIGSVLAPWLVECGFDVTGLDTGYYSQARLFHDPAVRITPATLHRDVRQVTEADLEGFNAVVHLAELSNDPLGEHSPEVTFEINHQGSVSLARAARNAGVSRFVYTSSCSVYGVAEGVVDETSPTNPQTAYAQCKVLVERDLTAMASDAFSPTFLRNATAYGASPSMRFDIVLNNLAGLAWTQRCIAMTSDGTPWRPLVHVRDICTAIRCALAAPAEAVHNQVFNVGATDANYQVRDIAGAVARALPDCELSYGPPSGDNRSYRVNFDKIHQELPGFSCQWDLERGAAELLDLFERVRMDAALFEHPAFTRLQSLKQLVETGQLDQRFFWTGR
jgi:nucleoside-diphosphate-sugar epimerase